MSVKPIDKQLMYQNSLHEAKHKQNQQNKPMATNQMLENEEAKRLKKEESRIQKGEETRGQRIKKEEKNPREEKKKNPSKKKGGDGRRGRKLDVRI